MPPEATEFAQKALQHHREWNQQSRRSCRRHSGKNRSGRRLPGSLPPLQARRSRPPDNCSTGSVVSITSKGYKCTNREPRRSLGTSPSARPSLQVGDLPSESRRPSGPAVLGGGPFCPVLGSFLIAGPNRPGCCTPQQQGPESQSQQHANSCGSSWAAPGPCKQVRLKAADDETVGLFSSSSTRSPLPVPCSPPRFWLSSFPTSTVLPATSTFQGRIGSGKLK